MPASERTVFDDLVDFLADGSDANKILQFKLPAASQARLEELLQSNREGKLTDREQAELRTFEQFEHVVRLLKARVAARRAS